MSNTPNADQWKHGGNCNVCRRARYCRKRCSENGRLIERMRNQALAESRLGRMIRAMDDTIRETEHRDDG